MFQKYTDIITMFHISHLSNACINSGERVVTYLYRGIDFISFYNIIPPLIERGLYCNHLVCPSVRLSICPSVHTFVKDVSAATGRNDFIFDTWLWHSDLYRVSPFQVYRTSTSFLQCDLELFMFAVIKTFVTDISASTGRNDFIFDIWLLHGDLYRVSPFQVTVITNFFSLWLHKSLLCTFQPVYNDLYWFIMICAELDVSD